MNRSFLYVIKILLSAAWRRRYMLFLPVLLMLPVSVLWGLYGPRTYVAKSLMLLQEAAPSNPLSRDTAIANRIQERMAGLQALLKSDRVLGSVYRDLVGDGGPREMAVWIRDFSGALTVELIGTDFLEFQLKGGNPKGLGKRLEVVTSRFLEALLPEQNALVASQVLLEKRKEEVESTERALAVFRQRLLERMPQGISGAHNRLAEARAALQAKEAQLQNITQEIGQRRARIPAAASNARVEQEIAQVRGELATLEGKGDAQAQFKQVQAKLSELLLIRDLETSRGAAEQEVRELSRQMEGLIRAVRQTQPVAEQLAQLEREAAEAKEAFEEYSRRYARAAGPRASGSGILNAPERIKLIDAPRDPEFPTVGAMRIALMALIASIVLGLGLAIGAELLDPRMRSPEEAADATGLPVIARLS